MAPLAAALRPQNIDGVALSRLSASEIPQLGLTSFDAIKRVTAHVRALLRPADARAAAAAHTAAAAAAAAAAVAAASANQTAALARKAARCAAGGAARQPRRSGA